MSLSPLTAARARLRAAWIFFLQSLLCAVDGDADVVTAATLERVARFQFADPASDDLSVALAIELAYAQPSKRQASAS